MPVALQLPGACDLQPLIEASVWSDILSPVSSCAGSSELLEIKLARGLELAPNCILLRDQLVLLCTARQRDDAIELGGAQIEIARAQGREAVVDGALLIDLDRAFGENLLDSVDGVLIEIRGNLLDC